MSWHYYFLSIVPDSFIILFPGDNPLFLAFQFPSGHPEIFFSIPSFQCTEYQSLVRIAVKLLSLLLHQKWCTVRLKEAQVQTRRNSLLKNSETYVGRSENYIL